MKSCEYCGESDENKLHSITRKGKKILFRQCKQCWKEKCLNFSKYKGKTYEELHGKEKAYNMKKISNAKVSKSMIEQYKNGIRNIKTCTLGMQAALQTKILTTDYRRQCSIRMKQWHKDNPEKSKKIINVWHEAAKKTIRNTKPELQMKSILESLNLEYIQQFRVKNRFADFYLPKSNTIIEVDGLYWHNYPHGTERDKEKDILYKSKGYIIQRFWESKFNLLIVAKRLNCGIRISKNQS